MSSVSLINGHIDDDMEEMTPQEAINFIDNEVQIDVRYCSIQQIDKTIEVFAFAKEALEKQIPQKTTKRQYVPNGTLIYGHCPNCDWFTKNDFKYCGNCGQALDWSDTE